MRTSTSPRRARRRASSAPASAASAARSTGAVPVESAAVARRAIVGVELVAQRLPATERFGVGLAVALAHASQRVRAVADRRLRLRVESVEAAVPNIGPGACWLHRRLEYRGRVSWADDLERAAVAERVGRRPGSWPPPRSSSRKQAAPSTPASRSAGQCVLVGVDQDDAAWRRSVERQVEDVARRLVGQGQRRDPLRLGQPDREVGDDRAGERVERMADRGHHGGQLVVLLGGVARPGAERRQQRDREEQRAEDRRAAGRARRPAGSSRAGRPTRAISASSASSAETISRTWTGPAAWRNVPHVVATGKTQAGDQERREADDEQRPDRGAADRPRQRRAGRSARSAARAGAGR